MREIVRSVAITLAAILMASAICFADAPIQRSLDPDYIRTDFTVEDGLPDNVINATVETENGLLWVGTESGLATFDGRDFNPIRLHIPGAPSQGAINTLLESSNGDLWVGSDSGLVLIPKSALDELDPARMTFYSLGATRSDEVEAILETSHGVLWVGTTHGLYRREGANFVKAIQDISVNCLGEGANGRLLITTSKGFVEFDGAKMIEHPGFAGRFGLHDDQINDVFRDRRGVLWFSTQAGIRRQGSNQMPAMGPHQIVMTQAVRTYEDRQGSLWVTTGVGAYRVTGDQLKSPDSRVNARCLSVSRDGTVWMGTNGNGLVRLKHRIVHMFTKADGMQEDIAMAVLPGDDGKLWIGNNCGFAEFDGRHFKTYNEKDGLLNTCVWSLAEDRQKTIWIGTYGGGIFSFRNGHFTQYSAKQGLASTIVFQLTVARDDSLWIATPDGVSHMREGRFTNYSTADGLSSNRILCIHEDKRGTIWAETQAGLDRLGPHGFSPFGPAQLAIDQLATRFAEDRSGELYTTNSPKGISRIDKDRVTVVNQTLSVMDMVEADDQYLWLSSRNGIFRIRRDDLTHIEDQDTPLDYQQIDRNDGLNSTQSSVGFPNIAITADRKLWLATVKGLAMVDLNHWPPPSHKPKTFLEGVTVEGKEQVISNEIALPAGSHHVEFHLAAVNLSSPEKIRMQYRMSDVDSHWLDADLSRIAVYTNIPVGAHTLAIRATDSGGTWDRAGISYQIVEQPFFYQTLWFQILLVGLAALTLTALYLARVRQIIKQTRTLLQERLMERERIALDLHDTFLQGVQGILLRVHTATQQIPRGETTRQSLEEVLQQSDQVMKEGRSLVSNLRSDKTVTHDLATDLSIVGHECREVDQAEFQMIVNGVKRSLHPGVLEDSFKIGREALINAFRHSGATRIEAEVSFGPRHLKVRIRDDGRGIEEGVVQAGNREGHFGLPGMRERAKRIGGHLDIWSRSGLGTEIELSIPARFAYRHGRNWITRVLSFFQKERMR
jgi:signal transduction histidine kinase/ligand-binding sensor domain-containing protein